MRFLAGFYLRMLSIHLRSQMQYRVQFLFDFLASLLVSLSGIAGLVLVFERFGSLGGWALAEVVFLWSMVESAFGWMDMIFAGFDPANFGKQIRLGRLDQIMLRPVGVTMQVLASEFVLRRFGRILQGLLAMSWAINQLQIEWTLAKLLYLPVVYVSVIAFYGALFMVGATITFWTVDSIEIMNVLTYGGAEMTSYPMHIYPAGLLRFFTYVLPVIFLNYYPALYLLGKPDPFGMPWFAPFLSPLVGLGALLAARAAWGFGLRHYQSSGT